MVHVDIHCGQQCLNNLDVTITRRLHQGRPAFLLSGKGKEGKNERLVTQTYIVGSRRGEEGGGIITVVGWWMCE